MATSLISKQITEEEVEKIFREIDYNHDGNMDLLLCGNMNQARIRFGKYDANFGMLLKGDGKGHFNYVTQQQHKIKRFA